VFFVWRDQDLGKLTKTRGITRDRDGNLWKLADARGQAPLERDQGGKSAVKAIRLGYRNLQVRLGLRVDWDHDFIENVAKCGTKMPTVQPMWPLAGIAELEGMTLSESENEGLRAYAGGLWLLAAASARPVEFQRTSELHFEAYNLEGGERIAIVSGVASKSKAASQREMKALEWRAPLWPIAAERIDLDPLVASMPKGTSDGCVFRDYAVGEGEPKRLENWRGWIDQAASHHTIAEGLRELMGPEVGEKEALELTAYGGRHVIPEIARAAEVPTHRREAVGYWRQKATVGDPADHEAWMRAVRAAREARSKESAMKVMANRYSSRDSAAIEQDHTRIVGLSLARAVFTKMRAAGRVYSTRETTNAVQELVHPATSVAGASASLAVGVLVPETETAGEPSAAVQSWMNAPRA
jgi:uncharacterized protein (DUF4415 family)